MLLFHGVGIALDLRVWCHAELSPCLGWLLCIGMSFWDVDKGRFQSGSDMKLFAGRCQHSIHLPWSIGVISAVFL